ncbi:hypothetical protein M0812_25211 [Anaeramoeba flamelloides]|uniref:Uncharacterized protein n=1 Tax=Anaeramoeba flamelloides TaxID=1746091 RepID=A0AAV7YCQ9_9EUKA|nr:hypothetical protein M0812_25211 [Anaeramoeba flamelloides]
MEIVKRVVENHPKLWQFFSMIYPKNLAIDYFHYFLYQRNSYQIDLFFQNNLDKINHTEKRRTNTIKNVNEHFNKNSNGINIDIFIKKNMKQNDNNSDTNQFLKIKQSLRKSKRLQNQSIEMKRKNKNINEYGSEQCNYLEKSIQSKNNTNYVLAQNNNFDSNVDSKNCDFIKKNQNNNVKNLTEKINNPITKPGFYYRNQIIKRLGKVSNNSEIIENGIQLFPKIWKYFRQINTPNYAKISFGNFLFNQTNKNYLKCKNDNNFNSNTILNEQNLDEKKSFPMTNSLDSCSSPIPSPNIDSSPYINSSPRTQSNNSLQNTLQYKKENKLQSQESLTQVKPLIFKRMGKRERSWVYGKKIISSIGRPCQRSEIIEKGKEMFPVLWSCFKDTYNKIKLAERLFSRNLIPSNLKSHGVTLKDGYWHLNDSPKETIKKINVSKNQKEKKVFTNVKFKENNGDLLLNNSQPSLINPKNFRKIENLKSQNSVINSMVLNNNTIKPNCDNEINDINQKNDINKNNSNTNTNATEVNNNLPVLGSFKANNYLQKTNKGKKIYQLKEKNPFHEQKSTLEKNDNNQKRETILNGIGKNVLQLKQIQSVRKRNLTTILKTKNFSESDIDLKTITINKKFKTNQIQKRKKQRKKRKKRKIKKKPKKPNLFLDPDNYAIVYSDNNMIILEEKTKKDKLLNAYKQLYGLNLSPTNYKKIFNQISQGNKKIIKILNKINSNSSEKNISILQLILLSEGNY